MSVDDPKSSYATNRKMNETINLIIDYLLKEYERKFIIFRLLCQVETIVFDKATLSIPDGSIPNECYEKWEAFQGLRH